jgi:hypothetical protein
MTQLWPRLAFGDALDLYQSDPVTGRMAHPSQTFAATGGTRVGEIQIVNLADALQGAAADVGYPEPPPNAGRISFDRRAAFVLTQQMDLSWSEASAREVWSFLALVPLAHLTDWRFGRNNRERWIASDLTRHTWARLWWQGTVFAAVPDVLGALTESDLNQLLERRVIGGDIRLTVAISRAVVSVPADEERRRDVIRDVAARLRRRLAFTDPFAMSDTDLDEFARSLVTETLVALGSR